jgi:hypothetical protein
LTFTAELTVDADKSSAAVRVLRSFGVQCADTTAGRVAVPIAPWLALAFRVAERGADFGDSNFFTTALNPKKAIAVLACVEAHAASALELLGGDAVLANLPKFELLHRYLAAAASVVNNERSIGNADFIVLQANAATTTAPYEQQLAKFVNLTVRDVFDAGGMPLLAGLAAASGPTGRTADRASNSQYHKMRGGPRRNARGSAADHLGRTPQVDWVRHFQERATLGLHGVGAKVLQG